MGEIWDGFKEALAYALAFFYDVIPSYGLAIILLTVSINLLLFPLTLRQTRATRAFQSIQPEIRRIQKQYKEEPEKLQQELMRVQREAGATPGGCIVPLLVQMPILLALFQLLNDPAKYLPAESALISEFSTATLPRNGPGYQPVRGLQQGNYLVFHPVPADAPAHGRNPIHPAMARPTPEEPGHAGSGPDPAGNHPHPPPVHRCCFLELPCRCRSLLGDREPLPVGPAGRDFPHRWPTARTGRDSGQGDRPATGRIAKRPAGRDEGGAAPVQKSRAGHKVRPRSAIAAGGDEVEFVEVKGRTVDVAVEAALAELGIASADKAEIEVSATARARISGPGGARGNRPGASEAGGHVFEEASQSEATQQLERQRRPEGLRDRASSSNRAVPRSPRAIQSRIGNGAELRQEAVRTRDRVDASEIPSRSREVTPPICRSKSRHRWWRSS